ncbi:hypothetical protein MSPP1_004005 [Malassezia sp. CBS 17886]|nr:hypothetical protein MSPP1_004005 [Malassezia sp. CBS 17886]
MAYGPLHTADAFFRDGRGRAVMLRGVNFCASHKCPRDTPSQRDAADFWAEARAGSPGFVHDDLPVVDAHLRRIRAWGFTCLRYVFTWEAIEHAGPGLYDSAYLDYTVAVLRCAKTHGFYVIMDPHQDVFSRFAGGSGAPYWVHLACGMRPEHAAATSAALLHNEWPLPTAPDPASCPKMAWATNYTRLAAQTLFTLFFGGRTYAPRCTIDGKNIQDWLQEHFLSAVRALVVRVRDAGGLLDACVIGWDSLNEPSPGYIGTDDLARRPGPLRQAAMPTAHEAFLLGAGRAQRVPSYEFGFFYTRRTATALVDPRGTALWLHADDDAAHGAGRWGWTRGADWDVGTCIWAQHGVWDTASGTLLRADYFASRAGFVPAHWLPHWRVYTEMVRAVHADAIAFVQPPVFAPPPDMHAELDPRRACASPHFYDGATLMTKRWNWFNVDAVGYLRGAYTSALFAFALGDAAVRRCLARQLRRLREDTALHLGRIPTWIGETGIPMDLRARNRGRARVAAMDATLSACDANLLNYALWAYVPSNTHAWGDGWNGEDFSLWNREDVREGGGCGVRMGAWGEEGTQGTHTHAQRDPDANAPSLRAHLRGTRGVAAWCRPYPTAVGGVPRRIQFNVYTGHFTLDIDACAGELTEVYLPYAHYGAALPTAVPWWRFWICAANDAPPDGPSDALSLCVHVTSGDWSCTEQRLAWRPAAAGPQRLAVRRARGRVAWGDMGDG